MGFRHGLIVTLLGCAVLLSGCDRNAPPVADTTTAAASTAPAGVTPPPAASAPATPKPFLSLVAGVDYAVIDQAPTDDRDDSRIDVVEGFSYACSHCAEFEPKLVAWRARLPADVHFEAVPLPLNEVWTAFARGHYAAIDLGIVERTHAALFEAIHAKGVRIDSVDALVRWYVDSAGVDATAFRQAMDSSGTDARVASAQARAVRWGIDSTPTLVVGNRYRVLGFSEAEGGFARTLAVADALIAELRKSRSADA